MSGCHNPYKLDDEEITKYKNGGYLKDYVKGIIENMVILEKNIIALEDRISKLESRQRPEQYNDHQAD